MSSTHQIIQKIQSSGALFGESILWSLYSPNRQKTLKYSYFLKQQIWKRLRPNRKLMNNLHSPLISEKMTTTFHHIFFLKKPKNYQKGPVPIYLRITIDGKRAELTTGREIEPHHWGNGTVSINFTRRSQEGRELASYLNTLREKLYAAHQSLIKETKTITTETLRNKYTGTSEKQRMLIPIFQQHNDDFEKLVPQEYSTGTFERYKTSLSHTKEFIKYKYKPVRHQYS